MGRQNTAANFVKLFLTVFFASILVSWTDWYSVVVSGLYSHTRWLYTLEIASGVGVLGLWMLFIVVYRRLVVQKGIHRVYGLLVALSFDYLASLWYFLDAVRKGANERTLEEIFTDYHILVGSLYFVVPVVVFDLFLSGWSLLKMKVSRSEVT